MPPEEFETLLADTYARKAEEIMTEAEQSAFRRKLALAKRYKKLSESAEYQMIRAAADPDVEHVSPGEQSEILHEMGKIEEKLRQEFSKNKAQAEVELAELTRKMELLEGQLLPKDPSKN